MITTRRKTLSLERTPGAAKNSHRLLPAYGTESSSSSAQRSPGRQGAQHTPNGTTLVARGWQSPGSTQQWHGTTLAAMAWHNSGSNGMAQLW